MSVATYENMLRRELDENKTLTNAERMEILKRLAKFEDKRLQVKVNKSRLQVQPRKFRSRSGAAIAETLEPAQPLGQRVDAILAEMKKEQSNAKSPEGDETKDEGRPAEQSGN